MAASLAQETDNPDLRDRAYVYWRLLSSDPEAARAVVLAEKPVISQGTATMDPQLLATLLGNLSTLSSVYHLPPSVRAPFLMYLVFVRVWSGSNEAAGDMGCGLCRSSLHFLCLWDVLQSFYRVGTQGIPQICATLYSTLWRVVPCLFNVKARSIMALVPQLYARKCKLDSKCLVAACPVIRDPRRAHPSTVSGQRGAAA